MFLFGRRRLERRKTIERLYGAIVAQARTPAFYRSLAVPDTIEGRFDLMVLHMYLVCRRLTREDDDTARDLSQALFDEFCADMDASLREYGIGDLGVPRRMREIGEAFYGRAAVYDAALAGDGNAPLATALLRNVYSGAANAADPARHLARYVRHMAGSIEAQAVEQLAAGELSFPALEVEA